MAVSQTVYLICIRVAPGNLGDPNVEVVSAKLTQSAAETVKTAYPGSWITKLVADKQHHHLGGAAIMKPDRRDDAAPLRHLQGAPHGHRRT